MAKTRNHIMISLAVMLIMVGFFLWREHSTAGTFGFPLDDSWIHAQFAHNIVLGHGFSYNPGVPASGSTAPLWTWVSATGLLVTGDPVLGAKLLGVVFLGLSVCLIYMIVRTVTDDPREALFASVIAATLPRLLWASVSGMEVTLAVALTLSGVLTHILYSSSDDRRQYLSTVLFGLATLARPECAVFFVAAMIDRALVATLIRWREMAAREWLVPVVIHVAVLMLVLAPSLLFSRRFGIGFLPNTAYAKALLWGRGLISAFITSSPKELARSLTVHPFDYYLSFLQESLRNNPVLFAVVPFGFLRLLLSTPYKRGTRYQSFMLPLAVVLFPLAIGIVVPFGTASYQEGRYTAPVVPLMLIIGTMGLYAAASYGARLFSEAKYMGRPAKVVLERTLIWFLMAMTLLAQGRNVWHRSQVYGREVANIEQMQVSTGKWLDQNVPPDAVIATNDVGAIAYFSRRRVLDTVGLISPEVLEYRRGGQSADEAMYSLLDAERPDYAVVFPTWYPRSVKKDVFEPIHRVVLRDNIVAGGDELVVYELRWERQAEHDPASRRQAEGGRDGPAEGEPGARDRPAEGEPGARARPADRDEGGEGSG